jgi:nucleoside-diphosphate-sugar epimerase
MMRLIVTGGAGSLGTNIIEHLGDRCERILVLDNFATGKKAALLPRPNMSVIEGTIEDVDLVDRTFADFQPTHVIVQLRTRIRMTGLAMRASTSSGLSMSSGRVRQTGCHVS